MPIYDELNGYNFRTTNMYSGRMGGYLYIEKDGFIDILCRGENLKCTTISSLFLKNNRS
jgi:hypothetical protein